MFGAERARALFDLAQVIAEKEKLRLRASTSSTGFSPEVWTLVRNSPSNAKSTACTPALSRFAPNRS